MKFLKLEPTVNDNKFVGWVNNPLKKVCSKVLMEYTDIDTNIEKLNAVTDYVRFRRMDDKETGQEKLMISLKQGDTIFLPKGYTFDNKSFIKINDEEKVSETVEYEILLMEKYN